MSRASGTCVTITQGLAFVISPTERRKCGAEKSTGIMAENLPNLAKDTHLQMQDPEQTPDSISPKKSTLRHIVGKFPQTKKVLKAERKTTPYLSERNNSNHS